MTDILGLEFEGLKAFVSEINEPSYRAKQIYTWLHKRNVSDYDTMTDLPEGLRKKLTELAPVFVPEIKQIRSSNQDGTKKYLFELNDGQLIESVLMHYKYGYSICISSQAGCAMGCSFCASTVGGFIRNLSVSEMLGQIYRIASDLEDGGRISHIVIMGVGEPLLNLETVLPFIRIITSESGYNISARNITISTCGIVPGIKRLAAEQLQVTLALSLHAATQELRQRLMPVAKKYPLEDVMNSCDEYFRLTGRRITYEYAMIRGINDSDEDARALIRLIKNRNSHVNLIPLNQTGKDLMPSSPDKVRHFQEILAKSKINVTIRRSLGNDIDGACGQLRRQYKDTSR